MSDPRSPFARPGSDDPAGPGPATEEVLTPRPRRAYAGEEPSIPPAPPVTQDARIERSDPEPELTWQPDPSDRPRSRTGLWLALGIAALVLIVACAFVIRALLNPAADPRRAAAERAVGYLRAIAAGDAQTALAVSFTRPSGPLLTNEALARHRPEITDIEVIDPGSGDSAGTDVVLGYKARGREVRGTFPVFQNPQGEWQMRRGAVQLRLAPTPKMVPLVLDGAKLDSTGYTYLVDVFPGVHTISGGSKWLAYATPEFVVEGLNAPSVDATTKPTPAYPDALRQRIEERVARCLASTELAPAGCPWARKARSDQPVQAGSVSYSLVEQRFKAPAPNEIDAIARGAAPLRVRVSSTVRVDGVNQKVTEEFDVAGRFAVDLLSEGPDFIWE